MWATSKVNRHDLRNKEIEPHLLTLRFENKAKSRKVTKTGSTFF